MIKAVCIQGSKCMKICKVIACIALCFLLSTTSLFARAGGGGSGGGGGGSSGGGSSSGNHTSSNTSSTPTSLLTQLAMFGVFIVGSGYATYRLRYKVYKKHHSSKQLLKELDDIDPFWKESTIKKQVEDIYYLAQNAWTNKNIGSLRDYVSDDLYENWRMKLDWMDIRNERNVLDRIKLLSTSIVGVYDAKLNEHDFVWVCVRGKMVDYKVDETTNDIIEGDTRSHEFLEYWKFIRKEESILLDEVQQIEDMDVNAFVDFSEEVHPNDKDPLEDS